VAFSVPSDVLDRLDIAAAVDAEILYKPPYLPPSPAMGAIAGHREEIAQLLLGWYRTGFDLPPGELIQVPKRRRGLRPVTVTDFAARVVYRALIAPLEPELPQVDRSFERKKEIERAPLEHPGTTHVLISDVAAFYDFVDHGLLEEELVSQTGESTLADVITQFLHGVMGRDFGLPQVLHASDVLSETFIDIAERRLLRAQLPVWRYNDDFYVAATSWPEANIALELLDREIRRLGLTLNETKTLPLRADRYSEWLARPETLWNEINENVEIDLRAVGFYADEEDPPEVPDEAVLELAALRALEVAIPGLEQEDRLQVEVNRQLAVFSINALRLVQSNGGLPFVRPLLSSEPQLTHHVSGYLESIAADHPDELLGMYEQLLADQGVYISPWQGLWLFEPLRRAQEMPPSIVEWVTTFLEPTHPDFIRARSALALAEKQMVAEATLAELYGSVGSSKRLRIRDARCVDGES
jgi:RNA-directed DNA polymerase